eukprot:3917670-Prymnesium_polylepis.1
MPPSGIITVCADGMGAEIRHARRSLGIGAGARVTCRSRPAAGARAACRRKPWRSAMLFFNS